MNVTTRITAAACVIFATSNCGAVDYIKEVQPILDKYCAGCHNDGDAEGKLSLESFDSLSKGGDGGLALVPKDATGSRMIRLMTGAAKPLMPPEDEPRPTDKEIAVLTRWIDSGAKGPSKATVNPRSLATPKLRPSDTAKPITSVAFSPDGEWSAMARFKTVEVRSMSEPNEVASLAGHVGKINSVEFSQDGRQIVTASGVTGLYGEAKIWDAKSHQLIATINGHRDTLYVAKFSPDAKQLATGSYDKKIIIWDVESKKKIHTLDGHNGAVYDLAYAPDGKVIASASADATIKVWSTSTGKRLDTRSEPLKEQYSVDISPDGKHFIGAGEDNRIRMWRLTSVDKPQINPLVHARFAHEGTIERVRFTSDNQRIVSAAADNTLKVWDAEKLQPKHVYEPQSDSTQALAVSAAGKILVGRMNGSHDVYPLKSSLAQQASSQTSQQAVVAIDDQATPVEVTESEPNNAHTDATVVQLPAQVSGKIYAEEGADVDYFRFAAKAGQRWIVEVKASRDGSSLDSQIEVLTAEGKAIPRVLLQAVRDSYFTFRGKDSRQTGDFRVHNWEEMTLNQYLYSAGEVVKLYHYPRGPDSGFNVYPNTGNRHAFFDTSAVTHALHEPCYIVQPHPPGTELPPNGLPVFTVYYENDDESTQSSGKDSKLTFTVPVDGDYVVRVRDVRGFAGDDFQYKLLVRPPKPDFSASVNQNHTIGKGLGKKLNFRVKRMDGFDGEVRLDITGVPEGFHVTTPVTIEAGQLRAWGMIWTDAEAKPPSKEASKKSKVIATAMINGKEVTKEIGSLGDLELSDEVKLTVDLKPDHQPQLGPSKDFPDMPVIELTAGSSTTATIRIERKDFHGRVSFGSEEGAVNAPHGVYVDNIGLNGLLIVNGASERQFFIRAEPWVKPVERVIFVEAGVANRPTSQPVVLRILPNESALQVTR